MDTDVRGILRTFEGCFVNNIYKIFVFGDKTKETTAGTRNILVVMLRRGYKVSSIELGLVLRSSKQERQGKKLGITIR